jgi:phospholipid/cholesterol/gamma-HCH transport system permease protein
MPERAALWTVMPDNEKPLRWDRREDVLDVRLPRSLDAAVVAGAWNPLLEAAQGCGRVTVDASALRTCDGAGMALLRELSCRHDAAINALDRSIEALLESASAKPSPAETGTTRVSGAAAQIHALGKLGHEFFRDCIEIVAFVGELAATLAACARHPRLIRWNDLFVTAERAGVNALPIVGVISLLTGMILAFQASTALRQFGADIFVVNLVSLAMLREMGVIMTAVVLAGRSGSAFAAEIGSMKINEEIDALRTMGLDPVRFLAVPRVLAGILVMPPLVMFSMAAGIFGGFLVMRFEGFPMQTLWHQLVGAVTINDLLVGLVKSFFMGLLVAAIGCLRGLQTRSGSGAVGISTTRAVVSGIFLIVLADAVFSMIFYVLKI